MYKAVVSDLDGTLLNTQHRISDYTQAIIRSVISRGIPFIIATGRHYCDVTALTQSFVEPLWAITSNGARAHDRLGKVLYQQNMASDEAQEVLAVAAEFDVHQSVYEGDKWLVEEPNSSLLAMHPSGFGYEKVKFQSEPLESVVKLFFVGEADVLQRLRSALIARLGAGLNSDDGVARYLQQQMNELSEVE